MSLKKLVIKRHRGWVIFSGETMVYPTLMPTRRDCIRHYLVDAPEKALSENHSCRQVTVTEGWTK